MKLTYRFVLECGIQSILSANANSNNAASLAKMAAPGDWPWHVSLHRDATHVCDGTLVSENWVLTTESCFQGQSKATWVAVLGNIRLNAMTPWSQRRRIVSEFINLKAFFLNFINNNVLIICPTDWNGKIPCRRFNCSFSTS